MSSAVEREEALIAARKSVDLQARTDVLTGLANRLEMLRALDALLEKPDCFAVMQLDMNNFKGVNDTFGHNAGDALLRHFADILTSETNPDWVKARTGGDEFVILAPDLSKLENALASAREIVEATNVPMAWKEGAIVARPSIGVAMRKDTSVSAEELLNAADVALYAAKGQPDTHIAAYDTKLHQEYIKEQKLHKEVSRAFATSEITFHFQPIVDMRLHRDKVRNAGPLGSP